MFHELWIGIGDKKLSFKNIIYSYFQREILKIITKVIKPNFITTSIEIYRKAINLDRTTLLPLFGNIKIAELEKSKRNLNKFIVIHFGTFSSDFEDFYKQVNWLKSLGIKNKKKIQLLTCGEGGIFKRKSIEIIIDLIGKESIIDKGVLSEREISILFQESDFGISRADFSLYGKSGTTMAMLEHGLPVLLKGEMEESYWDERIVAKQLFFSNDIIDEIPSKNMPSSNLETVAKYYTQLIDI